MKDYSKEDWSAESTPLIKGPGQEQVDILVKECARCGKRVQHIKNVAQNHVCEVKGRQFGHGG